MKMEVETDETDANETLPEEENEEKMEAGLEEGNDSSDSEDSDDNDAVINPRIQQLELQVIFCFCAHMMFIVRHLVRFVDSCCLLVRSLINEILSLNTEEHFTACGLAPHVPLGILQFIVVDEAPFQYQCKLI